MKTLAEKRATPEPTMITEGDILGDDYGRCLSSIIKVEFVLSE